MNRFIIGCIMVLSMIVLSNAGQLTGAIQRIEIHSNECASDQECNSIYIMMNGTWYWAEIKDYGKSLLAFAINAKNQGDIVTLNYYDAIKDPENAHNKIKFMADQ